MSDSDDVFYTYNPNKTLPIVASAIFGIGILIHLWNAGRTRSFNYMWPFISGVAFEIGGYVTRTLSVRQPPGEGIALYIVQQLVIIVAPALLAASLYMSYGRLCLYVDRRFSPLRPTLVTRIFVTFDVVSFLVQGAGGGMYGDDISKTQANIAKSIIIVGFVIQIVAFSIFLIISYVFYRRAKIGAPNSKAIPLVPVLWITATPILVRTVFRLIEFASSSDGENGFLLNHEAFLWVLETLPIVISVLYFGWFHPSRYIPNNKALREEDSQKDKPLLMANVQAVV